MPLGMEVGFGPGHIMLDWDPAPHKKGESPQFSAHVRCGHTAGCIKMPLGAKVGFRPGHIVLDGDPAFPRKGHSPPIFGPCLLWPNGRPSQLLLKYSSIQGQKCAYFCQKPTEVDWQVDHMYSNQSVD